jgi:MFS family permease
MTRQPGDLSAGRVLPPVLAVQFIGALGISLVLPFLVFLVERFGGNALIYGLLGATYPAWQMMGAPWLGSLSDRVGRRPVLMLSQAGTLLSWILFLAALQLPARSLAEIDKHLVGGFAITLPLLGLFVARALDGLTGGNISVAQAVVADISGKGNRSKNFGRLGMAANLGFIIGPALAGLLGGTRFRESVPVAMSILVSAFALLLLTRLPETHPQRRTGGGTLASNGVERAPGWRDVLDLPGVPLLLVLYFIIFLGFNVFYTAFPVHAATELAWSPARLGLFFAVLSGLMILVQGPVLSWLAPRMSPALLVAGGNVILALSFAVLTVGGEAGTWVAAPLFALGNGVMWPSYLTVLSTAGGRQMQGAVQGRAASMGSAASIVGLILGGLLHDALGAHAFWVSSITIAVAGLLSGKICARSLERAESDPES